MLKQSTSTIFVKIYDMFKYLLSPIFVLFFTSLSAQNSDYTVRYVNPKTGIPGLIQFNPGAINRPSEEAPHLWFQSQLNANSDFTLKFDSRINDKYGNSHSRYNQYYNNFLVEGAQIILHSKNKHIYSVNGRFFPYLSLDTRIQLSPQQAYAKALSLYPNSVYMWEVAEEEQLLKLQTGKANATYKPSPELVIFSISDSCKNADFRMAYKIDLYVYAPIHTRQLMYIDANTGEVLEQTEQICSIDYVGMAETKYSGLRQITCDSIATDSFVLHDHTRGKGILTMDVRVISVDDSSRHFLDADNFWNNVNAYQDEVATDVHFGSAATYDFFKTVFNRNSYDDSGALIYSKVHYLNKYNNANWNGTSANYGDGDGTRYRPLTSLDICAHELTHAVTGATARLRYRNESGALNESFSDVFAKAVEYMFDSAGMDWYIGRKIVINSTTGLRSMSNPHESKFPKYYYGQYYYTGNQDNGGVHYNSSVQNFWFYLLCKGGSGMREDGKPYTVQAIGIEKATEVAYANLTAYLSNFSEFIDATYFSLDAAAMMFGQGSFEYQQIENAWYAVGLFEKTGLQSPSYQHQWSVMPNPGNNTIQLYNPTMFDEQTFEIVNTVGQVVMSAAFKSGDQIQVNELESGIYFIRIGHVTLKWIKN